jgi:DNA-binding SARP family transcriptional activator
MLAAKFAAPYASNPGFHWPALENSTDRLITLFVSPPGYLYGSSLADALKKKGRSLFWLRIGPEDRDPATFLLSLIGGLRKILPDFGASTLSMMQRNPGPVAGWPPLYAHLAEEMAGSLPKSSVIVLEHAHILSASQPTLAIFGNRLLAGLPASLPCVILSHRTLPSESLPAYTNVQDAGGLKMDVSAGLSFANSTKMSLPISLVQRVLSLMDGRAVPLAGIVSASRLLGLEFIQHLVAKCRSGDQLLDRIVQAWLSAANADELRALALAMDLDYIHPEIVEAVFGSQTMPSGPWLQSLESDWHRIWCLWNAPLRSALNLDPFPRTQIMKRTAEFLIDHDAGINAVGLLLEMDEFASAATVIEKMADGMLNLGQWSTLERWFNRLPGQVLYERPQLIYTQGELSAAHGLKSAARRSFATAARLFSERQDQDGASKSLLAEGTLAVWENQTDHARICALMANATAASAGLSWYQGLASWMLGCLSASSGQMDDALIYFGQAASFIKEPHLAGFFNQAETLAQRQHALHRQREFHQQAFRAAVQSEQDAVDALVSLINAPMEDLPSLLDALGWSKAPLILKLASPPAGSQALNSEGKPGLWQKMRSLLGLVGMQSTRTGLPEAEPISRGKFFSGDAMLGINLPLSILDRLAEAGPSVNALMEEAVASLDSRSPEANFSLQSSPIHFIGETEADLRLSAYTMGDFNLSINDLELQESPSGRGLAVLKFLIINHDQKVPREVLMDTLWRDAEPNAARNRLNVSMHSLRSALRTITEIPIVLFGEGNYFLNPDIQIWIDFEEFERHLQAGRQLEAAGQLPGAIVEYEVAASLYQGDFLEEDLYEDWPVLTRERLRVAFLDVLDRLSQIYFSRSQYAACVALCGQILERDNCREDAHCRLMRCFSRQGQQLLALRQYQICVDALRQELDIDPEPATTQLAERIRRRESF